MESLQELTEKLKNLDLSISKEVLENATGEELIELLEILTDASTRVASLLE